MPKAEFIECAECAGKPGMPVLCPSCLHNRAVISVLCEKLETVARILGAVYSPASPVEQGELLVAALRRISEVTKVQK